MNRSYLLSLFSIMMLLTLSSCGGNKKEQSDPVNVRLFTVEDAGNASRREFPGRVKAAEEVNMAFKVSGSISRIFVNEGDYVRKGQVIAQIDPRDYQVQYDATYAEYLKVKAEAERVIALYGDSVATADAYDKARYGLRQITAKYDNARNQLADTRIYAPFNGRVQKRFFDPPTVIGAGMPVLSLISEGQLEIEINIPASLNVERNSNDSFSAAFDFLPDQKVSLTPLSVSPKANANQLFTMRLAIPGGLNPRPAPGMTAMVTMLSQDPNADSHVEIPSSAILYKSGKAFVWIFDKKSSTISRREVSADQLHSNGNVVISAGLQGGEQVVLDGVHKLSDHQKVHPLDPKSNTNPGNLL